MPRLRNVKLPRNASTFLAKAIGSCLPLRVVDVGASPRNVPPYHSLLDRGLCEVWGFEPQEDEYAKLERADNSKEHYFPFAVGPAPEVELHIFRNTGFTSKFAIRDASIKFLGRFARHVHETGRVKVACRPLDAIEDLPLPDLLKIDVQGAELEIIAGGRQTLAEAVAIIPEVRFYQLYEGEPTWAELDVELREQGFVLHKLQTARSVMLGTSQFGRMDARKNAGQLVDGDAVYIRSLDVPDMVSDRQLAALAILADGVFDSRDLTVRCLDLLVARGQISKRVPRGYVEILAKEQAEA